MKRIIASTAIALTAALTAALSVTAAADASSYLQSPTGNIVCNTRGHLLSCDVKSANVSYNMLRNGRAWTDGRHGYTYGQVAEYGVVYHRHGFTCASDSYGMTCSNRSGHGFFLSREDRYAF